MTLLVELDQDIAERQRNRDSSEQERVRPFLQQRDMITEHQFALHLISGCVLCRFTTQPAELEQDMAEGQRNCDSLRCHFTLHLISGCVLCHFTTQPAELEQDMAEGQRNCGSLLCHFTTQHAELGKDVAERLRSCHGSEQHPLSRGIDEGALLQEC